LVLTRLPDSAKRRAKASVAAGVVVMAAEAGVGAVMAAVAAQVAVAHAVAAEEVAVTVAAVAVAAVEAVIAKHNAEHHPELQCISAHPLAHTDGALRLKSKALFILNALSKILKLIKEILWPSNVLSPSSSLTLSLRTSLVRSTHVSKLLA
jgi:hypothetical protein